MRPVAEEGYKSTSEYVHLHDRDHTESGEYGNVKATYSTTKFGENQSLTIEGTLTLRDQQDRWGREEAADLQHHFQCLFKV